MNKSDAATAGNSSPAMVMGGTRAHRTGSTLFDQNVYEYLKVFFMEKARLRYFRPDAIQDASIMKLSTGTR